MNIARFRPLLLAACFAAIGPAAFGQGNSDVYLVRMSVEGSTIRFSVPVNVTNRPGADTAPVFLTDDSALLYASYRNGQADIFRYDIATSATTRLTDTPETELDPQPARGPAGFSAVRIETDRQMRLWSFPFEGDTPPALLVEDLGPVSRHAWGYTQTVATTVLGDTTTLRIADLNTGDTLVVAAQVAGPLCKIPQGRAVSYVSREDDGWVIQRYDISNKRSDRVTRTVDGERTEHVWLADAQSNLWILMADGPVIYGWEQMAGGGWKPVIDFSGSGITTISRIAVNSDGTLMAFVAERPPVQ